MPVKNISYASAFLVKFHKYEIFKLKTDQIM